MPARIRRRLCAALLGVLLALTALPVLPAEVPAGGMLRDGVAGLVVLLRHAEAPGVGDPPGFRIGDCATQRNLSDEGRAQARRVGERLRRMGIGQAAVRSSQWCRCLDTARLLGLGPVEEMPALNSFFGQSGRREERVAAVRRALAALPPDGPPVVLVTHQVTITALTGIHPASGEAVLLRADGSGNPPMIGRLADPGPP